MEYTIRPVRAEDYDGIFALWNLSEQSRRALNPVDDSREGIAGYLRRNPDTCFLAETGEKILGVILAGHDGRRGLIHHLSVDPANRRQGIASRLVASAEEALKAEGIAKVFCLVFRDNDEAEEFWEAQGYTVRTDIRYYNKSLDPRVPTGR